MTTGQPQAGSEIANTVRLSAVNGDGARPARVTGISALLLEPAFFCDTRLSKKNAGCSGPLGGAVPARHVRRRTFVHRRPPDAICIRRSIASQSWRCNPPREKITAIVTPMPRISWLRSKTPQTAMSTPANPVPSMTLWTCR